MEVRVLSSASVGARSVRALAACLALALALMSALAGCGDDSGSGSAPPSSSEKVLAPFLGDPPAGYRYEPAKDSVAVAAFIRQIKSDFDADAVEIRNVWRGSRLAAGLIALRAPSPMTPADVALRVFDGEHSPPRAVRVGGKEAHLVVSSADSQVAVIDTDGRLVLIVTGSGREPLRVARAYVR